VTMRTLARRLAASLVISAVVSAPLLGLAWWLLSERRLSGRAEIGTVWLGTVAIGIFGGVAVAAFVGMAFLGSDDMDR